MSVRFSPAVRVREFEKGSSEEGKYSTRLTWTAGSSSSALEYYKELESIEYSPLLPTDATQVNGGGGGVGFRGGVPIPAPTLPPQHQHQQQHPHGGWEQSRGPTAPPLPTSTSLPSASLLSPGVSLSTTWGAPLDKRIDGWHLKPDACIYQGPKEHSSAVISVQGNVASTKSGTRYLLGDLDPRVAEVLAIVAPGMFDPLNPLSPTTRMQLLYAERVVYGQAAQPIAALMAALKDTEAALGHPEVCGPQFAALRQILHTLGAVTPGGVQ